MGLFWTRPQRFVPLDGNSRNYLNNWLNVPLPRNVPSGSDYLALCDLLLDLFQNDSFPVHSFPELSWAAYQRNPVAPSRFDPAPDSQIEPVPSPVPIPPLQTYTIDGIIADGCFLDRATLEKMVERLRTKRNIILQGPPGAGKTWLSKRLAYALLGSRDDTKIRHMQFHPNLSYEDFVRGYLPQGDGKLALVDGPFLELCDTARQDPHGQYVMVIEEINRGNPASIFGELLTLLEADKRDENNALRLAYTKDDEDPFHIPPNLYVIGTMNLADRSLAIVDFALRRRFAFFDLEPTLNNTWRSWVSDETGIPTGFLDDIARKIHALNNRIENDPNLGEQFRIGHSHVTPAPGTTIDNPTQWFTDVIESEIAPLLRDYWFDSPATAREEIDKLLSGL